MENSTEYETFALDGSDPVNSSIVPEKELDILVIKGRFKFDGAGIYGVFSLLISKDFAPNNKLSNNIIEYTLFASYFSDIYHIDLTESWISLEEKYNQINIQNNFAASITNLFKKGFDDHLYRGDAFLVTLLTDYQANQKEKIKASFESIFVQIHKGRSFVIELSMEELNSNDISSFRKTRAINEKPAPNLELLSASPINVAEGSLSVPANPMLAPVADGISVQDLTPNMKILMKLDTSTAYGQKWVDIFKAFDKQKGIIKPIVATVNQVGPIIKNKMDILVLYTPTQYTKFNIEAGVKIRLYNPHHSNNVIEPLNTYIPEVLNLDGPNWDSLFQDMSFRLLATVGVFLVVLSIIAVIFMY